MSLGQIIMYHELGIELKYGKKKRKPTKFSEMTPAQLKKERDKLKKQFGDIGGNDG